MVCILDGIADHVSRTHQFDPESKKVGRIEMKYGVQNDSKNELSMRGSVGPGTLENAERLQIEFVRKRRSEMKLAVFSLRIRYKYGAST